MREMLLASAFGLGVTIGCFAHGFDDGGFVTKSDPSNGQIVIVNLQSKADRSAVESAAEFFRSIVHLPVSIVSAENEIPPNAKVKVFVKEVSAAPTIFIDPDNLIATVNVTPLAEGSNKDILRTRTVKAITRAICFVCGGGGSLYPRTINGPIKDLASYDTVKPGAISPDTYQRMTRYLSELGVRAVVRLPYESACEEGWAPKPTNAVQRAIWEKVHAPPSKPMKITYDKAAQKPVVK